GESAVDYRLDAAAADAQVPYAADPYAQPEPTGRPHGADPVEPPHPPWAVEPSRISDEKGESGDTVAQRIAGVAADAERRRLVRELARNRLRPATGRPGEVAPGASEPPETGESGGYSLADIAPLRSEIAAAVEDSDFLDERTRTSDPRRGIPDLGCRRASPWRSHLGDACFRTCR